MPSVLALEVYFYNNGKYPQAKNSLKTCTYGSNCYVFSTQGSDWIAGLVPSFMSAVPVDPKNNAPNPWDKPGGNPKLNYSYSYGNVCADGEPLRGIIGNTPCVGDYYDLTANLENTADPDRSGVKDYTFFCDNQHWNNWHSQLYEKSPPGLGINCGDWW